MEPLDLTSLEHSIAYAKRNALDWQKEAAKRYRNPRRLGSREAAYKEARMFTDLWLLFTSDNIRKMVLDKSSKPDIVKP